MQRITLVLLVLLAVGLGAFVYFYEIRGEPRREAEKDAQNKLFDIDNEAVDHIELVNTHGALDFEKQGTDWFLTGEKRVRADATSVDEVIFTLNGLRIREALGVQEDLSVYGLETPRITVVVSAGENEERLEVGDDTPFGGMTYVRTGRKPGVYLVSYPLESKLDRGFDDWRDKQILSFTPSKVTRIAIEAAGGTLQEVFRDGASWKLASSPHQRLDAAHFQGLLYDLDGLTAVAFTGSTDLEQYGLEPPRWTVTIVEKGDEGEVSHRVMFGEEDDETRRVPVVCAPGEEVRLVRMSIVKRLEKPMDELRDKRVVPVERFLIGRLRLTLDGQTLEAQKEKESWSLEGSLDGKVGVDGVASILDDLADLEAEALIDNVPEGEWARFGLETPFLTAVMSETDPDGNVTGTFTLHLGEVARDEGDRVFARVEGDPTIYQVSRLVADDLRALLLKGGAGDPDSR